MVKLKVYRTAIGFHDAYVAAPSMKAALRAWGSDKNLFARGLAEMVVDPALVEEPLANPGIVFQRSRGTAAEQMAALDKSAAGVTSQTRKRAEPTKPAKRMAPRSPKPDRSSLDAAETAFVEPKDRYARELADLDARIHELQAMRTNLIAKQGRELTKLEKDRLVREAAYRRKLDKWHD